MYLYVLIWLISYSFIAKTVYTHTYILGSTCNWKCLAEKLNVCHDNLHSIEATKRLCDTVREHQKQSEHYTTVYTLYHVLKDIGANCAARALIWEAHELCEQRRRTSSDMREYCKPGLMHPEKQHKSHTVSRTFQKHTINPRHNKGW